MSLIISSLETNTAFIDKSLEQQNDIRFNKSGTFIMTEDFNMMSLSSTAESNISSKRLIIPLQNMPFRAMKLTNAQSRFKH